MLVGWLAAVAAATGQSYTTPVRVSWVGDVCTTAAVTWDRPEAGRGTVRYGLTTNYSDTVHDGGGTYLHVVHLNGLTPDTRYCYEASSSDGFVQTGTFRSAPEPGAPVSFVFQGDLQGGLQESGAQGVADQIVLHDPPFVVNLGDMAEEAFSGSGFGTWEDFFRICSNMLSRTVFMPIMGNHDAAPGSDYARGLYQRLFSLPEPSLGSGIYAFTVGNTRYITLNTEEDAAQQSAWLSRELQAAGNDPEITWIFTMCHRPPYSWGFRPGSDEFKDEWTPILTRYEADFMVSGHSHNYQRSDPIRGVRYMVSGGGGGSLYDSADPLDSAQAFATTCYHYVSCDITNDVLTWRAIRSDGLVFDTAAFTNRRQVRVDPAFPLRGETATISYRATEGPLAGADPVYIHLGQDAFTNAFADEAMTWNAASERWEYAFTVPATATQRVAFVFRDAGGPTTNWHNNYTYDWQALLGRVRLNPEQPVAGGSAILRYDADMGPLADAAEVTAWTAFDGQPLRSADRLVMSNPAGSRWETTLAIPPSARQLTVAFSSDTGWDDDYRRYWTFPVTGAATQAFAPEPIVARGSPAVSSNPPGALPDNIGDNFDLVQQGPPLRTQVGPYGFGDWGSVWLNADETNLYIGATGVDMAGTNNVMALFLGLDTLTDNAWNLWHKNGLPNALDFLHNVRFTEPMDIVILLGDTYADGPDYTNFTYGGYNFGQGIYYIGTNSDSFFPLGAAKLSQFHGTGTVPCATEGTEAERQTTRWETAIPWSSLNAAGPEAASNLFVCGVFASDDVSGDDRYLSRSTLGERAWGDQDTHDQYGFRTINIRPQRVNFPHGDLIGDGLSNEWRQSMFGTPGGPPAGEDTDGDGFTNRAEEIANTHPLDGDAFFAVEPDAPPGTGPGGLRWPFATGREYDVYYTPDLLQPFQPQAAGLVTNGYTPATGGFYSVKVRK